MSLNEIAKELPHSNKVQFSGGENNLIFTSDLVQTSSSILNLRF